MATRNNCVQVWLVAAVLTVSSLQLASSFQIARHQSETWQPSRRRVVLSVEYKRGGGKPANSNPNNKKSGWDNLKNIVYGSVDGVNDLASKINKNGDKDETQGVSDGYSSFERSMKQESSPVEKIMGEYQSRATSLMGGVDNISAPPSPAEQAKKRSGFDSFKENVYSAADAFSPDETTNDTSLLGGNVPYKRTLAQDLNNEDLVSSNLIKRLQAEQEIREREAQMRAKLRNEDIKAKKQDLYKLVDAFQASVDALPEKVEQTERVVKDVTKFVKTVPNRVDKVVENVKTIPDKVQETADLTKKSVDETIDKTKQAVDEVIDIPNKVSRKFNDTKKYIEETKESIDDAVTDVKVFFRLEKAKPKPPKLPPPKPKTGKELAMDLAGGAAKGAGNLAWWGAKGTANLAWTGAKAAYDKGKESVQGPTLPVSTAPADTEQQRPPPPASTAPADTEQVEKEIADALKLAEASLRKSSIDSIDSIDSENPKK